MIEFYEKQTGTALPNEDDLYFIRGDGSVWRDNCESYESQSAVIGFENCVAPCPQIGWRLKPFHV